jgi:tetratricopeptide (TPR) repeat protein
MGGGLMNLLRWPGVLSIIVLGTLLFQSGCVHNVPLKENVTQDIRQLFPVNERIHAKVGVYYNDDLRNYVYRQEKMGMTFQMEVGKYLIPISMQMISAIFDQAVEVNSLPPYMGSYRPDVEAVIEPEILHAYGNAVGTLSGQVEARVKFRIKAYDLSGKMIWQGEALGENRSEQMDFVTTFLGNMDKVGRVGYLAGLSAAQKIVRDFNASRPPELYSLLELKALSNTRSQKKSISSEQFDKYCQKGMYHFEKKNFQQALYSFQQASKMDSDDLLTQFYLGVCHMYTGQKSIALADLRLVLGKNPRDQKLASDCKNWVQRLNDPLKVAFVFLNSPGSTLQPDADKIFPQSLANSEMYEIVEINKSGSETLNNPAKWNKYLEDCSKKGIKVVLCIEPENDSRILTDPGLREGDTASEFRMASKVRAYGTSKKKLIADFTLTETVARLRRRSVPENESIQLSLLKRSSDRLVLSLLENNIF